MAYDENLSTAAMRRTVKKAGAYRVTRSAAELPRILEELGLENTKEEPTDRRRGS